MLLGVDLELGAVRVVVDDHDARIVRTSDHDQRIGAANPARNGRAYGLGECGVIGGVAAFKAAQGVAPIGPPSAALIVQHVGDFVHAAGVSARSADRAPQHLKGITGVFLHAAQGFAGAIAFPIG